MLRNDKKAIEALCTVLDPFLDEHGKLHVTLPDSSGKCQLWPANSPEVRAFVSAWLFEQGDDGLPSSAAIQSVCELLRGIALRKPRQIATTSQGLPVLTRLEEVVQIYANEGGGSGTPTELRRRLTDLASRRQLLKGAENWPDSEDALGKQLAAAREKLAAYGVVLNRNETARPRTWSIMAKEFAGADGASILASDESVVDVSAPNQGDTTSCGSGDTATPRDTIFPLNTNVPDRINHHLSNGRSI